MCDTDQDSDTNKANSPIRDTVYRYASVPIITSDSPTSKDVLCDFLIDGYIRSECNQNLFLFPISVKQIIASYYNDDKTKLKKKLKGFIDKKTKFQRITQERQEYFAKTWELKLSENKYMLSAIFLFFCAPLIISIIAIIIGFLTFYSILKHQ
eukprot:168086_1